MSRHMWEETCYQCRHISFFFNQWQDWRQLPAVQSSSPLLNSEKKPRWTVPANYTIGRKNCRSSPPRAKVQPWKSSTPVAFYEKTCEVAGREEFQFYPEYILSSVICTDTILWIVTVCRSSSPSLENLSGQDNCVNQVPWEDHIWRRYMIAASARGNEFVPLLPSVILYLCWGLPCVLHHKRERCWITQTIWMTNSSLAFGLVIGLK